MYVFIQLLHHGQDETQGQYLWAADLIAEFFFLQDRLLYKSNQFDL